MEEKYYTIREAGEKLHRSSRTLYAYIRSGQLKAVKLTPNAKNSKFLIAESDLEAFIKAGVQPGYYQATYPRPHKGDKVTHEQ